MGGWFGGRVVWWEGGLVGGWFGGRVVWWEGGLVGGWFGGRVVWWEGGLVGGWFGGRVVWWEGGLVGGWDGEQLVGKIMSVGKFTNLLVFLIDIFSNLLVHLSLADLFLKYLLLNYFLKLPKSYS